MKLVAITGGIASGKSTVKQFIIEAGYKVIDSDEIAHQVLREPLVIDELVKYFGTSIIENKEIVRRRLGEVVFNDKEKLAITNQIIHPRVKELIKEELHLLKDEKIVFVDVPLLFEAKMDKEFKFIDVVYISEEEQLLRLKKRDQISSEFAITKMSHQIPLHEKITKASFVINNEGSLEETKKQVDELLRRLTNEI